MFLRTLGEPGDGDSNTSDIGFGPDPSTDGGPNAIARFQFPSTQMFLDNYGNVVRLVREHAGADDQGEKWNTYIVNVGTGAVSPFYGAEGWTVLDSTGRSAESDYIPTVTYSALVPFAGQGPTAPPAPAPAPEPRNYNPDIGPVYGPMTPDVAARVATLPAPISMVLPGGGGGENASYTPAPAPAAGKWLALGLMALAAVAS